jgi:hypothetical protein
MLSLINCRRSRGEGLTRDRVPMRTVGTVSSPPVTDRTKAAPSGSSQMLISSTSTPACFSLVLSLQQYGQPGRQKRVTVGGGEAIPVTTPNRYQTFLLAAEKWF